MNDVPDCNIKRLFEIPERVWDIYGLKNEPLLGKMTEEQKAEYLLLAHQTGKQLAEIVKAEHPGKSAEAIILEKGIQLRKTVGMDEGCFPMFACFTEPNLIEVSELMIERAQQELKGENEEAYLKGIPISELLLAHELFHYYEFKNKDINTNRRIMPLWHIGPYVYYSRVRALSEVAAMEFAATFLNCPFSPYILDILLLKGQSPETANELLKYVIQLTEKM